MAGRSHVDVSERRLRPVYDCLESGNNKKAIQEAEKVLKKQKDLLCAKVLKALALVRLSKPDDAHTVLEEVVAQMPTDDPTLTAMQMCYKELHEFDRIILIYENAHKAAPESEEILNNLFLSCVRVGDYKKQQQTALKLHRLRPKKNPYYFWGVMSIVLQAQADEKLAKSMYLPLAKKMTEKYINEKKLEAEAEVNLYLIIVEMLGDYEKELEILHGPYADKIKTDYYYLPMKIAGVLTKLKRWPEVNSAYRKLLVENPDNWFYYTQYFSSFFSLLKDNWAPKETNKSCQVDYTVMMVKEFLVERVQTNDTNHPLRGPYLAQLEFYKQLKETGIESYKEIGEPYMMLKFYYSRFGWKLCCFADMKPYVCLLDLSQQKELLEAFLKLIEMKSTDGAIVYASDIKQMQSHHCILQLGRHFGFQHNLSAKDRKEFVQELVNRYQKGLEFGKDLLPTELQYSDNYMLMALHILADEWRETDDESILWQMIVLLETSLKSSPSNFQMKILIINFYCTLGAFGPCPAIYESMEVKNLQNDTLGYIVSSPVSRLGHLTSASIVYSNMLRFFTVSYKEITESLFISYKNGSFNKIREAITFRERLQNSIQYAISTAEKMLLDLTLDTDSHTATESALSFMEIDPLKDKSNWDELTDNRDMSFLLTWDPTERTMTKEVKERSFNDEKIWLKVRNLTLRLLAASVLSSQQGTETHEQTNGTVDPEKSDSTLQKLMEELEVLLRECKDNPSEQQFPVQGPYRTRLCTYLQDNHGDILMEMLQLVVYVLGANDRQDSAVENYVLGINDESAVENDMEERLAEFPSKLRVVVKQSQCAIVTVVNGQKKFNADVLERLVLLAETISYLAVLAGVCGRILKPIKTAANKKKKKKKGANTSVPKTFDSYNSLVTGLEEVICDLIDSVRLTDPTTLEIDFSSLSLADKTITLQDSESVEKEVLQKVENSYKDSAHELISLLEKKANYLKSLRL